MSKLDLQKIEEFCAVKNKTGWGSVYSLNVYGICDTKWKEDLNYDDDDEDYKPPIPFEGVRSQTGACYAQLYNDWAKWGQPDHLFTMMHGRQPHQREYIKSAAFNQGGRIEEPYYMHESDRSVAPWTEWLLSDDSPWRSLNKHLVTKDAPWITKNALVFKDFGNIDARAAYTYLIAHRQTYEFPLENVFFEDLVSQGVAPKTAALASFYFLQDSEEPNSVYKKIPDGHQAFGRYSPDQIRERWYASEPLFRQSGDDYSVRREWYLDSEIAFIDGAVHTQEPRGWNKEAGQIKTVDQMVKFLETGKC